MKKYAALFLAFLLALTSLAACTATEETPTDNISAETPTDSISAQVSDSPPETEPIRVAGLKGATSIGMVKIMEDNEADNKYAFTIAGTADEITPKLLKGELDIAAVPANLASVLYNRSDGAVQVITVNTLGVLYIVEKGDTVNSIADLRGKTIYAAGQGTPPEYNLRYILRANGLDPDTDVDIQFRSETTEVVSILASAPEGVAMLPQPYVTVAMGKVEGLRTVLSLHDEWNTLGVQSKMVTGVTVVRTAFAQENPQAVSDFLAAYEASVRYVNDNVEDAAALVEKFGIFAAAVAKTAIPQCNIVFLTGEEMALSLRAYLEILFEQNPAAVGGALPDESFYRSE